MRRGARRAARRPWRDELPRLALRGPRAARILSVVHLGAQGSRQHTWEDFLALEEDDLRELIDGELLEIEVPNRPHERIVMMLGFFLVGCARRHGGEVLASGYKVRIAERRGVMPDVQYFGPQSARTLPDRGLAEGRPDLAVEVVSPSSRSFDRVTKLAWYASIGVPEYWIVDPEAHTLERYVLERGELVLEETASGSGALRPRSFPGLEIPLGELWPLPRDEDGSSGAGS